MGGDKFRGDGDTVSGTESLTANSKAEDRGTQVSGVRLVFGGYYLLTPTIIPSTRIQKEIILPGKVFAC